MEKILAYDYPTRIFHWSFALLFIAGFLIAKTVDDDSVAFSYHMLLGLVLGTVALLRIIWGFVGSRYARFTSFELNPKSLIEYGSAIFTGKTKLYAGHNPASSWAAILMILFSLGLAFTGIQMAQNNNKEFYEEVHELLSNAFLFTAIAHVLGVVFHALRHKDMIGLSMIHGQKMTEESQAQDISSKHPIVALFFIIIVLAVGFKVVSNFNSQTRTLSFFGTQLSLGEAEENETGEVTSEKAKDKDGDNDND